MLKYMVWDTETTGLNIVTDKPFLFQYGLVDENLDLLSIHDFDPADKQSLNKFIHYLTVIPTLVGANIKFEVHQGLNVDIDPAILAAKNYVDVAVLARLVISHDIQKDKAFSTALKKMAVRYLGIDSADEERKLKAELSQLTIAHKNAMKQYFIDLGLWDQTLSATKQTALLNKVYNQWNKVFHLYPHLKKARRNFLKANRAPNYSDCKNVRVYGRTDIKITHGLFKLWFAEAVRLQQVPALKRIGEATWPLALMERKGMVVDIQRLLKDRNEIVKEMKRVKIVDPRTGNTLSIGQHAKLKELYEYESGLKLNSADKETRKQIEKMSPAAKTASYIAKMDKYLATYITGILNKLELVDGEYKVFTQYNLAGTVTGRLSSNFQQFPRDALVLENGYEVNIRAWFVVPKKHKYMFYFDYSQMELRLQCEWTNIVNGAPDKNLARAFSPYQCSRFNQQSGQMIPFDNQPDWQDYEWFLDETVNTKWEPTDLHALTAKNAFPGVDESHPEWKHYRGLGKKTNFMVNYGGSAAAIQAALKVDFPTARALYQGYNTAFAGVVAFGKWLKKRTYITDNIPNLMLRRYYSRNVHLMKNWLVQGSGADILLLKIKELYDYIKDKPHWHLFLTVHDEIALYCDDIPGPQLDKEVEEIQVIMTHKLSAVDITVDVEYTLTKWSAKKDWKGYANVQ